MSSSFIVCNALPAMLQKGSKNGKSVEYTEVNTKTTVSTHVCTVLLNLISATFVHFIHLQGEINDNLKLKLFFLLPLLLAADGCCNIKLNGWCTRLVTCWSSNIYQKSYFICNARPSATGRPSTHIP